MDKNILAEYQKRVEDILVTLEKYQTIIDEGIEESQERTDNRLSELQARRKELEQPIDMSDVSATVIDRRSTIDREYSDDREGYLLSEYDKRRLDGYDGPKFAEIVDEIRTIRENRRLEQKEAVEEEMQELIAEQVDIANARDAEAEKASLIMQLQEEKDKIEVDIQSQKDNIEQEISEFDERYAEASIHKQVLTLYKDPNSKVYTAAKAELEKCTKQAETAQTKVKRLVRKISHLEQDLAQVDKLLDSLSDSREMDEVSRQEDEMWKAYRAEQGEQEEARIAKETEEEIKGYADGLNPEEPIKPEHSEGTTKPNPVHPTAGQKPQAPTKPQQPNGPKPNPKPEKWKVESVDFGFLLISGPNGVGKSTIHPYYEVLLSNGKEKKEVFSNKIAVLDEDLDREEIKTLTERKGIYKAEKCYDKGLATFLKKIDEEYGTESLQEYLMLLKDREMLHRYPEKYKDCMQIEYNFSRLTGKVSKEMKQLQKIAKECGAKGVAIYQKRPNIFQRIWRSLTQNIRLLGEPIEPNMSEKDFNTENMKRVTEQELEDRPYELDIDALKDYPEFSPEVAQEQLEERVESIEEKVHLDETIDAARKWREQQKIETPVVEEAEKETPPVERKPEEREKGVIVPDPADVRVLDEDGNEIGR